MSDPRFPDVPFADGVPPVLRNPVAAAGSLVNSLSNVNIGAAQGLLSSVGGPVGNGVLAINGQISNIQGLVNNGKTILATAGFGNLGGLLAGDDPSVMGQAGDGATQWGIFDASNTLVIAPDSFKSVRFGHGWRIADFPMEQGAFQSYNKVQTPFEVTVSMTKGGTDDDRAAFLEDLESAAGSFDLFHVVTPEYTYTDVSIEHYDYRRTNKEGAKLLTADIDLLEIRLAPRSAFTNTAAPASADAINGGTVQAVPVTTGDTATSASVQSAIGQGQSVLQAVTSQASALAPALPSSAVSAITSTLTPFSSSLLAPLSLPTSPVFAQCKAQLPSLLRIQ